MNVAYFIEKNLAVLNSPIDNEGSGQERFYSIASHLEHHFYGKLFLICLFQAKIQLLNLGYMKVFLVWASQYIFLITIGKKLEISGLYIRS